LELATAEIAEVTELALEKSSSASSVASVLESFVTRSKPIWLDACSMPKTSRFGGSAHLSR